VGWSNINHYGDALEPKKRPAYQINTKKLAFSAIEELRYGTWLEFISPRIIVAIYTALYPGSALTGLNLQISPQLGNTRIEVF
ncbi:MAG TPA: hypothetical protein VGC12_06775, partial [Methyloradius sp.]